MHVIMTNLLTMMKISGSDKQFATDDDVEADLNDDRHKEKQRELGHLEDSLPDSVAGPRKDENTELDVDRWLTWWTVECVVEKGWQTADE